DRNHSTRRRGTPGGSGATGGAQERRPGRTRGRTQAGRDRPAGGRPGQRRTGRTLARLAGAEALAGGTGRRGAHPQQDVSDPRRHRRGTASADCGAARLTLLRSVAKRGTSSITATTAPYGTSPIPMPSAIAPHAAPTGDANHHTAAGMHAAT